MMGILILRYTGWYFCKNILKIVWILFLNFSWNIRLLRGFCSVKSVYFFPNIIIILGTKRKTMINFLFFIIMILEWFLNLLTAFLAWSSVAMKSLSSPWSVDIFKNGTTILMKNLLEIWRSWKAFFLIGVILDFVFILSVKNGFTAFQKVLLSVMSRVLILLKKLFFSLLIKLTQRLRCLLYTFLSMSFFVLKNLFLRRDLFMISLFIFLFYKRRLICSNIPLFYGSLSLNSIIKPCFKLIKLKIVVLRSHLNNTIFNVKYKRFIRKVLIIPIR